VKLLLDENLSQLDSVHLRQQGYDAVAVIEAGLSGASDDRVRAYAIESGSVLVTLDADFGNILRFPPAATPGVIRLKIHPPTEEVIREQIQKVLRVLKDTSLEGCALQCVTVTLFGFEADAIVNNNFERPVHCDQAAGQELEALAL
jgi:predicted nuclease of predicted toxin-antitoxin system